MFTKIVGVVFYSLIPGLLAGEINLSGIFTSFSDDKAMEQRSLESKLESNLNNLKSIASSRIVIPLSQASHVESLWGTGEAKVLPVEVTLKLRKAKRLTENEYQSIYNMISSALSEKNQVVQPVIRDQDGFEWTDDGALSKIYFAATGVENEISDRLHAQFAKEVNWNQIYVSEKDGSCKISGSSMLMNDSSELKLRREIMTFLEEFCPSAKLTINVQKKILKADTEAWLIWAQNGSYMMIGFAIWGLFFAVRKLKKTSIPRITEDDAGAIIMTKIAERSPDQAAKWMVRAIMSESSNEKSEERPKPQIFDQNP